jgi:GntR family transcriptional regulator
MESQGVLVRRRGIGTFVSDRRSLAVNLSINSGITEMILSAGGVPGSADIKTSSVLATNRLARQLEVEPGSPIAILERVRTMDDRRISLSIDYYPQERIVRRAGREVSVEEIQEFLYERQSIYAFFAERLGLRIHHSTAWIRPVVAEDWMRTRLALTESKPMLYLEQVDYTVGGDPVILTDEYYIADSFVFMVHRSS